MGGEGGETGPDGLYKRRIYLKKKKNLHINSLIAKKKKKRPGQLYFELKSRNIRKSREQEP